ncbi:MAG: hypothetical protein ABUT20_36230 [Bacteroidota bacterium]
MKLYVCLIMLLVLHTSGNSQKFQSGNYIFKYCDLEYNSCLSTCKVVINKDRITVYATKELAKAITLTKPGDIIDKGIIIKHRSGKWIVGKSRKDVNAENIGVEGPAIIDFKKREYWAF